MSQSNYSRVVKISINKYFGVLNVLEKSKIYFYVTPSEHLQLIQIQIQPQKYNYSDPLRSTFAIISK